MHFFTRNHDYNSGLNVCFCSFEILLILFTNIFSGVEPVFYINLKWSLWPFHSWKWWKDTLPMSHWPCFPPFQFILNQGRCSRDSVCVKIQCQGNKTKSKCKDFIYFRTHVWAHSFGDHQGPAWMVVAWWQQSSSAAAAGPGEAPTTPAALTVPGSAPQNPAQRRPEPARLSEPLLPGRESAASQNLGPERGWGKGLG